MCYQEEGICFLIYSLKESTEIMSEQENAANPTVLNIIRFALLGWTLAFGVAAWFITKGAGLAPELVQGVELYVWSGLIVVFVGFFGGVLALRSQWQAAEEFAAKRGKNIIGWALAEGAALLVVVYLLMTGDVTFFGAGFAL